MMDASQDDLPQQHLLPKAEGSAKRVGSIHNELDQKKMRYIIDMRKSLCKDNICFPDGSLNLKYFNVKKGHYWSHKENQRLVEGVIAHGACEFKKIKRSHLQEWTETEIRLRICKLLRRYNIDEYKDTKFHTKEEILKEAKKNREEARTHDEESKNNAKAKGHQSRLSGNQNQMKKESATLVGGIYFNPPSLEELNREHNDGGNSLINNSFNRLFRMKQEIVDKKAQDNNSG